MIRYSKSAYQAASENAEIKTLKEKVRKGHPNVHGGSQEKLWKVFAKHMNIRSRIDELYPKLWMFSQT